MTYRDDREALKGRVESLERELADARRLGEEQGREAAEAHAAQLQGKIGGLRQELDRMESELRQLRGNKPERSKVPFLLLGTVPVLVAVGGAAYLVFAGSPAPPPRDDTPPQVTAAVVEPAAPVVVAPARPAKPEPPRRAVSADAERTAKARWKATVKSAQGVSIAAGSTCFVDALIATSLTNTGVPELKVTCGQQVIYDSEESFNGVSQSGNDALERMGPGDDKSTFTLQYSDVGTRSGRAQIDLDSNHREAAVFREHIPRMRVELSLPVESEPTAPLSGIGQRLRRTARVTEVSGAAPVKVDTACVLRAMPNGKQSGCVAEVKCGATVLLPPNTAAECTYDTARPVSVAIPSGDLQLTMTDAAIEVKSAAPKAFSAKLALAPEE